jgi:hypothetical protein
MIRSWRNVHRRKRGTPVVAPEYSTKKDPQLRGPRREYDKYKKHRLLSGVEIIYVVLEFWGAY